MALFAIPPIRPRKNIAIIKKKTKARIVGNISAQNASLVLSFILTSVFISGFLSPRSRSESLSGSIAISLNCLSTPFSLTICPESVAIALFPSITISE